MPLGLTAGVRTAFYWMQMEGRLQTWKNWWSRKRSCSRWERYNNVFRQWNITDGRASDTSRLFFADSSIHTALFLSLLLRFVSVPCVFLIFSLHFGQYFDMAEPATYSTPHTVQFLGGNDVQRFVGVICNSSTKPDMLPL